nr:hypothetical protein [Tanacetum cinerariifolium]
MVLKTSSLAAFKAAVIRVFDSEPQGPPVGRRALRCFNLALLFTSAIDDTTTKRDVEQSGRTVTYTTEDMQKKKNDVKARTTLLLSLPDEHQLRNDLDFMSLDDLYNHLKVYEAEVQKKSNSNSQDMAFISSSKNSSNEDGNTIFVTTASTPFLT